MFTFLNRANIKQKVFSSVTLPFSIACLLQYHPCIKLKLERAEKQPMIYSMQVDARVKRITHDDVAEIGSGSRTCSSYNSLQTLYIHACTYTYIHIYIINPEKGCFVSKMVWVKLKSWFMGLERWLST